METWIVSLIENYGYIGLYLGMLLEAIIIIIPSELILAMGGILAAQGYMAFWGVFFVGLLGSLSCALVIYYIGYYGGRPFIEKYGKHFFMKEEDIAVADRWFNKYGMIAALLGRNFPIVRTLISFPIGVTRLNVYKFMLYSTIGSIPWTFIFVYAGFQLGDKWEVVANYIDALKIPIIIILLALIGFYIYIHIKPKKNIVE